MFMGKQMILAVFVIAVALGTEAEFQFRVAFIRSAADGAFMLGHLGCIGISLYIPLKLLLPLYLSRIHAHFGA